MGNWRVILRSRDNLLSVLLLHINLLLLIPINDECVWNARGRVLHLQLAPLLLILDFLLIVAAQNRADSLCGILIFDVNRVNLIVHDDGLFWLIASLIQNAQIVPNFPLTWFEGRRTVQVVKRFRYFPRIKKQNCK